MVLHDEDGAVELGRVEHNRIEARSETSCAEALEGRGTGLEG